MEIVHPLAICQRPGMLQEQFAGGAEKYKTRQTSAEVTGRFPHSQAIATSLYSYLKKDNGGKELQERHKTPIGLNLPEKKELQYNCSWFLLVNCILGKITVGQKET